MSIFATLSVYHDEVFRSAAMNMAIDEALLECITDPSIRFYRWNAPALSFGYFEKFADVARHAQERDLVRRWTGGGIVFHGNDLTYSIMIPAHNSVFSERSMSIYEKVHAALRNALIAGGKAAVVAAVADCGGGVANADYRGHCFMNPVRSDVLLNGKKIAGAAQRRTRCGLLQQGSIQNVEVRNGLADRFASELAAMRRDRTFDSAVIQRATTIASQKYGTSAWLRRR
jgi:lipoate-protein ligase A